MAYSNGYSYRKLITIDNTKVSGSSNLTDFPFLFSKTDADLADTSNSGYVQNGTYLDIRFETTGGTKLSHEIESYTNTTGAIIAWVKIPTLSYNSDTEIYIYFGKSGLSSTEEDPTNVWDSNYKAVYHFSETKSTASNHYKDSTVNANHGTLTDSDGDASQEDGMVGKCIDFKNDAGDVLLVSAASSINNLGRSGPMTFEGWIRQGANYPSDEIIYAKQSAYAGYRLSWDHYATARITFDRDGFSSWKSANNSAPENTWTHIMMVYDGSSNSNDPAFFINGVSSTLSQTASPTSTPSDDSSYNLHIAADSFLNRSFRGKFDEFRFSDTGRTADWALTSYNTQSSPSTFFSTGTLQESTGDTYEDAAVFNLSSTLASSGGIAISDAAIFGISGSLVNINTLDAVGNTTFGISAGASNSLEAIINAAVALAVNNSVSSSPTIDIVSSAVLNATLALVSTATLNGSIDADALFNIGITLDDTAEAIVNALVAQGIQFDYAAGYTRVHESIVNFDIVYGQSIGAIFEANCGATFNIANGISSVVASILAIVLHRLRTLKVLEEDRTFRILEEDRTLGA